MLIRFPSKIIAALKLFTERDNAAKHDYLRAITFEVAHGMVIAAASDGPKMLVIRHPTFALDHAPVAIPVELFQGVPANNRAVEIVIEGNVVKVNGHAGLVGKKPLNWRKSVPAATDGTMANFDPKIIAAVGRAYDLLSNKGTIPPRILFNGEKAAMVDMHNPNYLCLIMPLYDKQVNRKGVAPGWAM